MNMPGISDITMTKQYTAKPYACFIVFTIDNVTIGIIAGQRYVKPIVQNPAGYYFRTAYGINQSMFETLYVPTKKRHDLYTKNKDFRWLHEDHSNIYTALQKFGITSVSWSTCGDTATQMSISSKLLHGLFQNFVS